MTKEERKQRKAAAKAKKQTKKPKKEKKPKQLYLIDGMTNYQAYKMSMLEKVTGFLLGEVASIVVTWLFFHTWLVGLIIGIPIGCFSIKVYGEHLKTKRQKRFLIQFRDLMEALVASYSAGKTTRDAFIGVSEDLARIYGENADIVQELEIIKDGFRSQLRIEDMLKSLAQRTGLEDIQNFSSVFEVKSEGADMKQLVSQTREIISQKIEVEMEIETIVSSAKNELYIMTVLPFVIMAMLNMLGDEMLTANTITNILIRCAALAAIVVAFFMGKKITDIKV